MVSQLLGRGILAVFIRKEGEDAILSPRPRDWGPYLDTGPVASDAFMEDIDDLPVQEREP